MEIRGFSHYGLASWLVYDYFVPPYDHNLIDSVDAKMHYVLESWASKPSEISTTHYLVHVEVYQRHMTTAAFRLVHGGDPSSHKPSKQNNIAPAMITKITKAFQDGICVILDGMVLLATNDPSAETERLNNYAAISIKDPNYLQTTDSRDCVRP